MPERYDDIFWENDRTAHRIYGPALMTAGPDGPPMTSSGIDVWVKAVRTPFMYDAFRSGHYHGNNPLGMDCYDTGTTRGCGGLGIWDDATSKLYVSKNWAEKEILQNGPDVASFWVKYADWDVGNGRTVREMRNFTLPAGTNFTRMVSKIDSNKSGELLVGIGIIKRTVDGKKFKGEPHPITDKAVGILAYWEPEQFDVDTGASKGHIGTAVLVDPKSVVKFVTDDPAQDLVIVRVTAGTPFVYYMGACWDKGLDFHSEAEWESYVKGYKVNFDRFYGFQQ